MPWKETCVMEQRIEFVVRASRYWEEYNQIRRHEAQVGERVRVDELDDTLLVTFCSNTLRESDLCTGLSQPVTLGRGFDQNCIPSHDTIQAIPALWPIHMVARWVQSGQPTGPWAVLGIDFGRRATVASPQHFAPARY